VVSNRYVSQRRRLHCKSRRGPLRGKADRRGRRSAPERPGPS
jgi:hypothetical protein